MIEKSLIDDNQIFSPSHLEINKGKKVCGIDLDDVLLDSIPAWINYANQCIYNLSEISKKKYSWIKEYNDLYDLKKNIPYYYYRLFKAQYRLSGVKKHLQLRPCAYSLLKWLDFNGYKNVILTARDQSISGNDTYDILMAHLPFFSEVIFDKMKHIRILEKFPNMIFMIEDNREIANIVGKWGYRVFLVDNKYNQGETIKNVIRVNDLCDVLNVLKGENDEG